MQGLSKALGRSAVVGVPVLGLLMALGPASSASTASVARNHGHYTQLSGHALASAKSGLERMLSKWHGMDSWRGDYGLSGAKASAKSSAIEALTKVQSSNWSGYADTGSNFSKVSAQWTEPTATCGSSASLAAFWVGIDGFASNSVEQDGTIIECNGGKPEYFDWWELFPTNAVQIVNAVNPGDAITATVTRSGTSYTLKITDSTTTKDSFSKTESCTTCTNTSAEWIAEAPSNGTVQPLSNFGVFRLHNAGVSTTSKSGDIISFTDDEITMADANGTVEAQPSSLAPLGGRFNVTWKAST